MSYEDTKCPCGGKKEPDTLLCPDCVEAFKGRPDLAMYNDIQQPVIMRRQCAIILITLAHKRKNPRATMPCPP